MALEPPPRIDPEEMARDDAQLRAPTGAHVQTSGEQANELLMGITKLMQEQGTSVKVGMIVLVNALIGLARARKLRRAELKAFVDQAWSVHDKEDKAQDKKIIVSHA